MPMTEGLVKEKYPLHFLVWNNDFEKLADCLSKSVKKDALEALDPRGRSPLFLAITLGHPECVKLLLSNEADATFEHSSGWSVLHEAVCQANPEMLKTVLEYRNNQKRSQRNKLLPDLLNRLKDAPDFYVEMKWEFSSWVPFLTRMCPGNMHRVYKMGAKVRIDSVLINSGDPDWSKGVSVIFQGSDNSVRVIDVDHERRQVYSNIILSGNQASSGTSQSRYEKMISRRLSHPAITSYINFEKIAFERNKSIWGWGGDKTERINGFLCKVFNASNVELITKMRYEHLSEDEKGKDDSSWSNLQRILSTFGTTESSGFSPEIENTEPEAPVTMLEYFDPECDLGTRDIGRRKEMRTKINKFKANIWLCENYPLNLQEQVMPIVDIMALSSSQFNKLKDFIQLQIPAGFPIKIEIPMFHVMTAHITFHNIFGREESIPGVQTLEENSGRLSCILDDNVFEPPPSYEACQAMSPMSNNSTDDDMFTWNDDEGSDGNGSDGAKVDIYEALDAPRSILRQIPNEAEAEEQLLQRAIEESILMASGRLDTSDISLQGGQEEHPSSSSDAFEDELRAALDLSKKETEEEERLRKEEEEMLEKALRLSMDEK